MSAPTQCNTWGYFSCAPPITTLTQRNSLIHCGTQDYNNSLWNLVCGQQFVTLLGPCCYWSMRCPDHWCDNGSCTGDALEFLHISQHKSHTYGTTYHHSHPSQSATTVTCRQCHKAAFGKDINRDSKVVTFIILNYNTRPLLSVSDKVLLSRHVNRQCCDSKIQCCQI